MLHEVILEWHSVDAGLSRLVKAVKTAISSLSYAGCRNDNRQRQPAHLSVLIIERMHDANQTNSVL